MNCADFEILLCDYLDGTLDRERRGEFERHMQTCPSCAELTADVRSAMSLVERSAAVEPPAELLTRILHVIPGNNAARQTAMVAAALDRSDTAAALRDGHGHDGAFVFHAGAICRH